MARSERRTVLPNQEPEVVVPARADAAAEPEPLVIRMPIDVRSASLTVLAVGGGLLIIQYAQSVLIPIVLGILISYAFSPLVGWLTRHAVPPPLAAGTAVLLIVATLGTGVYTLRDEVIS